MRPNLRPNPVLRRELLERWRGRRAFTTVTAYLTVLAALLYALYRVALALLTASLGFDIDAGLAGPALGRFLIESLLFTMLLLVLFVTPGYAAAQIAGERERRTLQLLQLTLQTPLQIVLGKLGASVAWVTLLVVAALPLGAGALFLGGFALADLLRGALLTVVVAVGVAGMALGISALARRTTAAIVTTYALVLVLVLGTVVTAGLEAALRSQRMDVAARPPLSLYLNPFYGLADAATTSGGVGNAMVDLPAPLSAIGLVLPGGLRDGAGFVDGDVVVEEAGAAPARRQPVWLVVGALHLMLGALGVALASWQVAGPRGIWAEASPRGERRGRRRRRDPSPVPDRVPAPAGTAPGRPPPPPVGDAERRGGGADHGRDGGEVAP